MIMVFILNEYQSSEFDAVFLVVMVHGGPLQQHTLHLGFEQWWDESEDLQMRPELVSSQLVLVPNFRSYLELTELASFKQFWEYVYVYWILKLKVLNSYHFPTWKCWFWDKGFYSFWFPTTSFMILRPLFGQPSWTWSFSTTLKSLQPTPLWWSSMSHQLLGLLQDCQACQDVWSDYFRCPKFIWVVDQKSSTYIIILPADACWGFVLWWCHQDGPRWGPSLFEGSLGLPGWDEPCLRGSSMEG